MSQAVESACGEPQMSQDFVYQVAVHLHRYLAPWLDAQTEVERVWVAMGFAGTRAETLVYRVGAGGAERIEVAWTMDGLLGAKAGETPLTAPEPGATRLALVRLDDGTSRSGRVPDGPLGFVLLEAEALEGLDKRALSELQGRTGESIRAARRNGVRLTLEGALRQPGLSIKHEIYTVLHHLPEWLGVDHSASLIITHDVGDMVRLGGGAIERAPAYDVMAERLFFSEADAGRYPRLVGMTVPVEDTGRGLRGSGLLACALRRQVEEPDRRYHRFVPLRRASQGKRAVWTAIDASGEHVQGLPLRVERPDEGRVIMVPLISGASDGLAPELLGWLRLAWQSAALLPASTGPILGLIADTLALRLRSSSLYTLSARQLLLLEQVRDALTAISVVPARKGEDPRDVFIGLVVAQVAARTGLPSFSVGQVRVQSGRQVLWFSHPHGWSGAQTLALELDDAEQSGVVGLSVRMARPIVLSGGSDDEDQKAWKNTTWVNEGLGLLTDERHHDPEALAGPGWRRLSSYYRRAHEGTYATLAFPILFGEEALGVIAVEVERRTTWLWWSGIGSQIFWRLLAAEIAMALKLLGNAQQTLS